MRRFISLLTKATLVLTIVFVGFVVGYAAIVVAAGLANAAPAHVPEEVPALVPPVVEMPIEAPALGADFTKRVRQDRVLAYSGGLLLEALSNATPAYTPGSAFVKQFLKQAGVQIQIGVMADGGLISHTPAVSFAQGFLVGL